MTQNQKMAFPIFKKADPSLTEDEFVRMNIYYSDHSSNSPKALETKLIYGRLKIHREDALKRENIKSSSGPYRCYTSGSEDWSRRDGLPLTQEDMNAINALSYGQVTGTKNNTGDMVAHVKWVCDSGD